MLGQSKLAQGAARVRDIALRRRPPGSGLRYPDLRTWVQRGGNGCGQLRDAHGFLRADVVGAAGGAANEDGPEPDGKVGSVEIGAIRSAVAMNFNGPSGAATGNEVADREMDIERHVGAG